MISPRTQTQPDAPVNGPSRRASPPQGGLRRKETSGGGRRRGCRGPIRGAGYPPGRVCRPGGTQRWGRFEPLLRGAARAGRSGWPRAAARRLGVHGHGSARPRGRRTVRAERKARQGGGRRTARCRRRGGHRAPRRPPARGTRTPPPPRAGGDGAGPFAERVELVLPRPTRRPARSPAGGAANSQRGAPHPTAARHGVGAGLPGA